eukprot:TRINITY_DN21389_c0_g1_i1.p1 TRINITY_DN21389_c0_g1~~TRINITY_DN21389_c0_g1_i1.p1  ORF type:complete len:300 (-),score=111.09 TRINITY_DN21389_c0_g1_i1:653-1444(-)
MSHEPIFFDWPEDEWPPFTPFWPIPFVVAGYLATIFGLQAYMKNKEPLKLPYLLAAHNFALSLMSLVLAAGSGYEAYRLITEHGWLSLYCGSMDASVDIRMARWSVAFYLSKYYELLDTVFLVLRKRELIFLHVYHHSIVIPVCWMAVHAQIFMGWITSFNNAFVHIFMYYYYGSAALGIRPSWGRYITSLQIFQFVFDMLTSIPFIFIHLYTDWPCRGELYAWIIANMVGVTFFLLFCKVYYDKYMSGAPGKKPTKKAVKAE